MKTTVLRCSTRIPVEPVADRTVGIGCRMIVVAAPKASVRINPRVSIVAGMADVTGAAMEAMEPWTRANKDPAGEPLGPIEAIGRASIRVIVVVAIRANRGRPYVGWADSDSHAEPNDRGMRGRRRHQANTQNAEQQ